MFLLPASEGWGNLIFSLCVSVHTSIGGYPILPNGGSPPHQDWIGYPPPSGLDGDTPCLDWMGVLPNWDWMGYPHQDWMGKPPSPIKTAWGYPRQEIRRQSSYAAGGMPLAVTQEDFLVCPFSYSLFGTASQLSGSSLRFRVTAGFGLHSIVIPAWFAVWFQR